MTLPLKPKTSVWKVLKYIITIITVRPIGLDEIRVIMYVST